MRQLLRRIAHERWQFHVRETSWDTIGTGHAILCARCHVRTYSLVAFTHNINDDQRSDRVIANAWDATFSLYDGVPSARDVARLRTQTPLQERGRFTPSELVLARANKSARLFEHVLQCLAGGQQPDISQIAKIGYILRTTAVYGSGKFGCADRHKYADRAELGGPFQAEMLAVFLIRWLAVLWLEHLAQCRGGANAVRLAQPLRSYLGVGNATGLGMAPFLVRFPQLVHHWVYARETAIARVRSLAQPDETAIADFLELLRQSRSFVREWQVEDAEQQGRIDVLRAELSDFAARNEAFWKKRAPFNEMYEFAKNRYSVETQEFLNALMLEPFGELVDTLAQGMSADLRTALVPDMTCGKLQEQLCQQYRWALDLPDSEPGFDHYFWYYSDDKLEPRLGKRGKEPGAEHALPLALAAQAKLLHDRLGKTSPDCVVAEFLLTYPKLRGFVARVQSMTAYPYGEVQDNLVGEKIRPIDMLRFKLAFFGVAKFDPKSSLWTRVNMFQGAPMPEDFPCDDVERWMFPVLDDLPNFRM